jgi:hypothetical protein
MKKNISTFIILFVALSGFSQNNMRKLENLIVTNYPGWPFVQQMIDSAKNKIEILSCDTTIAKEALYHTQVTTRSPMGAIIYNTGGILVDNGWIRILGSGNKKLKRSLPDWNKGKSFKNFGEKPAYVLIADDAVGGFFAMNGGAFGKDLGKIYYLSPDRLLWEPLDLTYTDFLYFCFNDNLNNFYENLRWLNWKQHVENLDGDKVFNFYPYLWMKEGKDINKNKRKIISVEKQFQFNIESRRQLGLDKTVQ